MLALAVLSTGCTATHAVRSAPAESGFLVDYSDLQKNPDFPAALVYVKPDMQWGKYSAIELESAGLHVTDTSTAPSPEEQTILAGMLHNTMTGELGKYFHLVTTPAPDALRVRTAWIQAPNAKPLSLGPAIPQLRIAIDVRDSVSGERLAAAVDARAETQAPFAQSSADRWSDVQPWIDYWSKRCAWQLWRLGVQLKPGATPPEEPQHRILF
jgi:hypothetical protein